LYYINKEFNHKLVDFFYDLDIKVTNPLDEESNSESLLLTLTIQKENLTSIDTKEKKNNIIENAIIKLNNERKKLR